MAQGGRGKKRCHFPPESDTIGNAITRKCKLGMLTYITMDISLCPSEWYQSAKFRVLAHTLKRLRNFYHSIGEIKIVLFLRLVLKQHDELKACSKYTAAA